jgi:uncharacterized Zn-binding protein involved in type VI secretion
VSVFQAARVGDVAGGAITLSPQVTVLVNGLPLAVVGSTVAGHGPAPHNASLLLVGSPVMAINGLPVVRTGLLASCGDVVVGTTHVRLSA